MTDTSDDLMTVTIVTSAHTGEQRRMTVLGEPTAVGQLVITPVPSRDGGYEGGFCLTHVPTGRLVCRAQLYELRHIAELVAHIDWSFTDPQHFVTSPDGQAVAKLIRAAQLTDPPGEFSPPAHDGWGAAGKGNGLKRRALPMIRDFLADYQHSCERISYPDGDVPSYVPDPDNPDHPRGKPNPEWHHHIIRQVNDYGLAYLLGALHRIDPEVADSAAAALADAWDAGDSMGEWAWQWARELAEDKPMTLHGIPDPVALFADEVR